MFKVSNPDFEAAIRASFSSQTFMDTLGAEIESVGPGKVIIGYKKENGLLQQHGFLHAGVGTSVVDSACGYAALSLAPNGSEVLTTEFKIHFLRPASGENFRAVGTVLKAGKLLMVCEGELFQDDQIAPIAKMTTTMIIKTGS